MKGIQERMNGLKEANIGNVLGKYEKDIMTEAKKILAIYNNTLRSLSGTAQDFFIEATTDDIMKAIALLRKSKEKAGKIPV